MTRQGRWSDFEVGLFVLAALGILVAGSLWIVGGKLFAGPRHPFDVLLHDSGGVVAGDRVRVAGVAVGRIEEVVLHPDDEWPVVMRILVKTDVVVHQDASAVIATSGILGTAFLEIEPGSASAPPLEPGGRIVGRNASGMDQALEQVEALSVKLLGILDQASELLSQVSGEIGPIMTRLQALLSEQNTENLEAILASTRTTLEEVSPRVGPLLDRLDGLVTTLDRSVEGVPALVDQTSELLADLETSLGPDGQRLADLLDGATTTLGSADEAVQLVLENRAAIEATLRDLETTMNNLKAFSDRLKQQPSSLLRSRPQQDRRPGDPMPVEKKSSGGSR